MGRVYSSSRLTALKKEDDNVVVTLRFDPEEPDVISVLDCGLWCITNEVAEMRQAVTSEKRATLSALLKQMASSLGADGLFQG